MVYTSVTTVVVTMMRMIIINIMKMMIRPTFCECTKLCMSGEFLKKSDQALLVNIRWRLVIKILWDSLIWKWEMKKHFFALFCTITLIQANIQPCRMFSYSVWRLSAGWDSWHISKTIAQLHIFNPITHSCDILWPRKTFSPSQRCLMANSTMSRKLRNLSHLGIVEQLLTRRKMTLREAYGTQMYDMRLNRKIRFGEISAKGKRGSKKALPLLSENNINRSVD